MDDIRYSVSYKISITPYVTAAESGTFLEPVRDVPTGTITHEDMIQVAMIEDLPSTPEEALETLIAEIRKTIPSILEVARSHGEARGPEMVKLAADNTERTKARRDKAWEASDAKRQAEKRKAEAD